MPSVIANPWLCMAIEKAQVADALGIYIDHVRYVPGYFVSHDQFVGGDIKIPLKGSLPMR